MKKIILSALIFSLILVSCGYAISPYDSGRFSRGYGSGSIDVYSTANSYNEFENLGYMQKTPKIIYDKYDISSYIKSLAFGDLGGGFTPASLVRQDNYLYMVYTYPIFNKHEKSYTAPDWLKEEEQVSYSRFTLTFGVGVAVSVDDGKTWEYVAKNSPMHSVKGPRFERSDYTNEEELVSCQETKADKIKHLQNLINNIKSSSTGYWGGYSKDSIPRFQEELDKQQKIDCSNVAKHTVYFYETDFSEVDYHGFAYSTDGSVDVYYSLLYRDRRFYVGDRIYGGNSRYYDIFRQLNTIISFRNIPSQVSGEHYKDLENVYELRRIRIKDGRVIGDTVVSNSDIPTSYIDANMAFVGEDNGKQFFVKDTNLYYSEDSGISLKNSGYKGFLKDDTDTSGKISILNITQMQKFFYWDYSDTKKFVLGYYNGSLYRSDGQIFDFMRYIGTKEQRKKMTNFARQTSYPLMKFDNNGNLHIIIMDKHTQNSNLFGFYTSPGLEADLYYQFIPAKEFDDSKDSQIRTVYFFHPSSCSKCSEFKQWLLDSGINVIENPVNQEFKQFVDSNQIVTVVKMDGGYNTIYGLNKIKLAKYLQIEIKPMFIDTYSPLIRVTERSVTPSDEIFLSDGFYINYEGMPSLVNEQSDGVYQYYYSLEGWYKQKIVSINIKDYPVKTPIYAMSEPITLFAKNLNNDGKIEFLLFKSREAGGIKYDSSDSPTCYIAATDIKSNGVVLIKKGDRVCDKYGDVYLNIYSNFNLFSKILTFNDGLSKSHDLYEKLKDLIDKKPYKLYATSYYGTGYIVPIFNTAILTNRYHNRLSGYEHTAKEYPYYTNYYDFYATKEYTPPNAEATATQLIPGAVFYLPLDDQEVQGKVVGQLAQYVVEEGLVTEDGEKYYRVKVDFSKKIKAKNSHINPKTIMGFLELDSGYASLTLKILDKPLETSISISNPYDYADFSVQSIRKEKGQWIVVNNLAITNVVCGKQIPANSYIIFSKGTDSDDCLEKIESGYEYIGYCNDWERVTSRIKREIMSAYSDSLILNVDENLKTNYEKFFGTSDVKIYAMFYVDDWVDYDQKQEVLDAIESGTCSIPTSGIDFALVEFRGSLFSDEAGEIPNFVVQLISV